MKKYMYLMSITASVMFASSSSAQPNQSTDAVETTAELNIAEEAETMPAAPERKTVTIAADTILVVTPLEEITSKKMEEGTVRNFRVAQALVQDGVTVIPLNSPVEAKVTWRTGKGIFGKSAKFRLTFDKVTVDGTEYALRGEHLQEGRGNTAAALLVSGIITGKSAVMEKGQLVNAFIANDITVTQ